MLNMTDPALIESIHRLLPQTQCTQCGYMGCKPYATAIAAGEADINQCPPGGSAGIARLARLLDRDQLPLNPLHGIEEPLRLALIEEEHCIGCTLCIQACPVDAIIGAPKQMHSVIADLCTGCKLCIPPCPVDCIRLEPAKFTWSDERAATARQNFEARTFRLVREKAENNARLEAKALAKLAELGSPDQNSDGNVVQLSSADQRKKSVIEAALARARQLREAASSTTSSGP